MIGYINIPLMLLVTFLPTKAGLATVGYTLHNPDGSIYAARSTVCNDLGNGAYSATPVVTEAWCGYVTWDTGEDQPLYAYEDISVVHTPVSATDPRLDNLAVDLSPVLAGLATETTQQTILDLLTIPDNDRPVVPLPVAARPGMQTLYGQVGNPAGEVAVGIVVTAELNGANVIDNEFLVHQILSAPSAVNGQWALTLVCGARYNITIPGHDKTYQNLKITAATIATLASYVVKAVAP